MIRRKKHPNEIGDYLKKNLKKGYTKESLKWALVNQGYSRIEVEKAILQLDQDLGAQAPLLKSKPVIKYEVVEPKPESPKSFWKKIFGG